MLDWVDQSEHMEKMKDGRLTKRLHRAYVGGSRRSLRPKRRRWRERVKEFVEQNGLFYRESGKWEESYGCNEAACEWKGYDFHMDEEHNEKPRFHAVLKNYIKIY